KYLEKFNNEKEKAIIELFHKKFMEKDRNSYCDWSCYDRLLNDIPFTTNICEGFNRSLNALLKGNHPSLVKLIMILRTQNHIQEKEINDILTMRNNKILSTKFKQKID
ncbi:hypothetical protein DMUE_3806, partial [Dictyocoela muelleri]